MNNDKTFEEQIKEYIKQLCETGRYDVSFDEFNIDVLFEATKHNIKGTYIYCENELDLTRKITLTEKSGKFSYSIYSSVDPKYIAVYAVIGYAQRKGKFKENIHKKEELKETNKKVSFFDKLFKKQ